MNHDQAKAAERLETGRYEAPGYVHHAQHGWWEREQRAKDHETLAQAYLAQIQRAREAVTAERLKEIGFHPSRTTHLCERVSMEPDPMVWIVVEFWGDGQIRWTVNQDEIHSGFCPKTMLDVDTLIDRIQRGGAT